MDLYATFVNKMSSPDVAYNANIHVYVKGFSVMNKK